jgi:hypothetical protein
MLRHAQVECKKGYARDRGKQHQSGQNPKNNFSVHFHSFVM